MSLFLFRFWPVLIPLMIYWVWHGAKRRKARKVGAPLPHFRDGPWYWVVLASLMIGVILFVVLGLSHAANDGQYVPPKLEDGKVIPGHVEP